jgi:4-hydroxybenzoate polyprenyltransferase
MVVNDYFDVPNDRVNAPTKPLPSGQITVDGALLFGGFLYLSTLVAAAWLEPRELRLLVASSAAVTLAYTPVLKKIPLVKTVAVAGVVALSPAAGALAVSSSGSFPLASSSLSPALAAVAPACLALFFAISGRELLMDAADARGDGAAGVPTLPVVAGRRATLALAAACELAAAGVLVSRAVARVASSSSSASASASASVARQGASSLSFLIPVTAALGTALVLPAARAASAALKLGRLRKEEKRNQKKESLPSSPSPSLIKAEVAVSSAIDKAVDTMMKPVGVAVIGALVLG